MTIAFDQEEAQTSGVQIADSAVASGSTGWRIETLQSLAEIRSSAHLWLALERDCIDPNASFQSYFWCESWAAQNCTEGSSIRPQIFLIYLNDDLVTLLPMMMASHMGAKTLTLFGEPHSQIAGALTKSGVDCTDGLRLCIAQLSLLTDADVVALGPVPTGSMLAEGMSGDYVSADPADKISLVTWPVRCRVEDYLAKLSKNRRKDFGKKLRRLESMGCVSFDRYDANTPEFDPMVKRALVWKREWLERNGMISLGLSSYSVEEFLTGFSAWDGVFEAEVEALTLDGKPVAISINLVGRNQRQCYLSAYDEAYAHVSPGTLAHQHAIHASIEDGFSSYSLLGYPTHFKELWTTETVPLIRYQEALTTRGKMWLTLWVNGARPLSKLILVKARKISDMPLLGTGFRKFLSALSVMFKKS